jgi:protein involved in polysaccharide export with SLBB domain
VSSEAGHDRPSKRRPKVAPRSRTARKAAIALGAIGMSMLAGGCLNETDAWLWDPSVTGRWEHTPTVVPVLDRIEIIESGMLDTVDVTEVRPEDLQVSATQYRVGPGDVLTVQIFDFVVAGQIFPFEVLVDQVGEIRVPQISEPIPVAGLNARQIERAIGQAAIDAQVLDDPEITVTVQGQLDQTYRIFGAVQRPGIAQIPKPDFRLLDAVIDAGGVSPVIKNIFVIRQVRTEDDPSGGVSQPTRPTTPPTSEPGDILDLIDDITGDGGVDPAMLGSGPNVRPMPDTRLERERQSLVDELLAGSSAQGDEALIAAGDAVSPAVFSQDGQPDGGDAPAIDLDGSTNFRPTPVGTSAETENRPGPDGIEAQSAARTPSGRWVFENGRWVRRVPTRPGADAGLPDGDDPLGDSEYLVAQRVIRVPVRPLIDGDARYNIVIRPGDIISVRSPDVGQVYIGGAGINRDGVYNLNGQTTVTLLRGVIAAGNFSAIGIPERVDLTRMVGDNRQATIRLNVRAIANGTAPDIILKPDDMLNFGTNFWATPLAVVRGGFRGSYGFGFLLDRNFGNDVFGAPPVNQVGQ